MMRQILQISSTLEKHREAMKQPITTCRFTFKSPKPCQFLPWGIHSSGGATREAAGRRDLSETLKDREKLITGEGGRPGGKRHRVAQCHSAQGL